ncbi:28S ribosomal protein S5-like protein [Leptotrombidium deliense]|uniref:Small ribosomal subunit protein uS5m n=1 Tax=Leptotrombidium deliense TaxID=299467 RepID=A0A443S5Q9_9ACAR|nr:28S ribosomal protein S5-like protein [Leptotrombidium deliense]
MVWPGLNAPVIRGREVVARERLPEDNDYAENLIRFRNDLDVYKKTTIHPMDRGWSSNKILGRWLGPPEPIDGEEFPQFNTKIVMLKASLEMSSTLGKVRKVKVMAITGNKNGAAGFGIAESRDQWEAIRLACQRAIRNIVSCNIHDGHTLTHDFYSRVEHVQVFAHKKPPGFGIVAHRVLKAICDCIGIKDLFVSINGPKKNYVNIVRAFFIGLIKQKTYQELADEKNLHLVEFREERDYFPVVVASPSSGYVRKREEILPNEVMDFHMHLYNGLIKVQNAPKIPAWTRIDAYGKYLQFWHMYRSRQNVRVYLKAKYGGLESFLTIREKEDRQKRKALLSQQSDEKQESVQQ